MLIILLGAVPVKVRLLKKRYMLLMKDIEGNAVIIGYNNLHELRRVAIMLLEKIEEAEKNASETVSRLDV